MERKQINRNKNNKEQISNQKQKKRPQEATIGELPAVRQISLPVHRDICVHHGTSCMKKPCLHSTVNSLQNGIRT